MLRPQISEHLTSNPYKKVHLNYKGYKDKKQGQTPYRRIKHGRKKQSTRRIEVLLWANR